MCFKQQFPHVHCFNSSRSGGSWHGGYPNDPRHWSILIRAESNGLGMVGVCWASQVPNKIQTRKIYPKFYFIFIFFITKNNMIVIKNSLFIILFLPVLGGLSYRKSLVSPGFSAGRAPFRQLRRFCRFSPQVRRLGSQLAAEGSAPRRAAAFWAQLLQQLSWGSMILGVWLYHHEKTMGIGSLFQNLDV